MFINNYALVDLNNQWFHLTSLPYFKDSELQLNLSNNPHSEEIGTINNKNDVNQLSNV